MIELQASITGAIRGTLQHTDSGFDIDVFQELDEHGDYAPRLRIVGRQSGETVIVRVETEEERPLLRVMERQGEVVRCAAGVVRTSAVHGHLVVVDEWWRALVKAINALDGKERTP